MRTLVLVLLAAMTALSADVAGRWKGEVNRPDGTVQSTVVMDLKQEGDSVSGQIGEDVAEMVPLRNVKQDGDNLTFEVIGNDATFKVALVATGDVMKGSAVRSRDGKEDPPLPMLLKRAK